MKKVLVLVLAASMCSAAEDEGNNPHLYRTGEEKRDVAGISLVEGVTVGGLIEVEAYFGEEDGEDVSDVVLATFELGADVTFKEWINGSALLLWEEDDTEPVELDEGEITIGKCGKYPFYFKGGKIYVPFGNFETHLISDPLVLELAETRESALLAGYCSEYFEVCAGAFNGTLDDDDALKSHVASLTVTPEENVTIGVFWISALGESDGLEETISNTDNTLTYDETGGIGGFVSAQIGVIAIGGEYITALEPFDMGVLGGEEELQPSAWNAEVALCFRGCSSEIALRSEGSDEFPGFPEIQYGVGASTRIAESAILAAEFLHGEFDDDIEDRNIFTMQAALEF